ncbi:hypothetical protein Cst_c11020 [Thermoclostridium stercorarium subsp. stercorarium DSM 8532]|uniref:Uncharacterized protein n=1 Tax=Thermoclostridium stercorarium (strain ATCC 35414 / DSM 8532 / NCIMB 11754) TaxID=1121335 RepID=L7VR96_THES1|nr:hypothetical protein Cst_c11020 [Thermoclostridium stercorarium subsp. stercorarium DSM 8532]
MNISSLFAENYFNLSGNYTKEAVNRLLYTTLFHAIGHCRRP